MSTPDVERRKLGLGFAPEWADAWGEDEFGAFACIVLGEVEQRMRWIPPGTFEMGSPDADRNVLFPNECPCHKVKIAKGFWIADTPCTQALWQAVMGQNPSRFRSPRRPVEQVSWDDVQTFLAKLNRRVHGLHAGLPTEAQWEYACRAGTTTATYAGPLELRGENDAPVLNAIAWYGGNSGVEFDLDDGWDSSNWPDKQYEHERAGTREVARKLPNSWGLHDMLGNVWEWCADGPRSYQEELAVDPIGPGGQDRVVRGGSWNFIARSVRAASRDWSRPGDRFDSLGFRLVRGQ
ncbi:MAG: formylglycine-generating enzyme family protein [Enhygromyxa sp.]